jgi:hypothetical protein
VFLIYDNKDGGTQGRFHSATGADQRQKSVALRDFHVLASQTDLQARLGHCQKRDLDIAARGF